MPDAAIHRIVANTRSRPSSMASEQIASNCSREELLTVWPSIWWKLCKGFAGGPGFTPECFWPAPSFQNLFFAFIVRIVSSTSSTGGRFADIILPALNNTRLKARWAYSVHRKAFFYFWNSAMAVSASPVYQYAVAMSVRTPALAGSTFSAR